jgi:DNA-directed RNA polymerase subunit RPC12/RpoP
MEKIKTETKIKCPFCEYEWVTMSEKKFVTCPDCLLKVNVKENQTQLN